jgi:hypothetical protein
LSCHGNIEGGKIRRGSKYDWKENRHGVLNEARNGKKNPNFRGSSLHHPPTETFWRKFEA